MFEITRFEARRRARGTAYLSLALLGYIALVVGLFPSVKEAGVDFEAYIQSLPPAVRRAFGGNVASFTEIEGFLAIELYQWLWLLVLGAYFAYVAATLVSDEVEDGTIDVLLVHPVSRTRVVVGKYLSLVPAVLVMNAATMLGTYAMTVLIGEEMALRPLLLMHGLSSVYLLACAAVGLLASVVFVTGRRAQTVGAGVIFAMFLIDSLTLGTDYEWIGAPALSRYFDPSDILVQVEVDWVGIAILLAGAVLLVAVSARYFERVDVA